MASIAASGTSSVADAVAGLALASREWKRLTGNTYLHVHVAKLQSPGALKTSFQDYLHMMPAAVLRNVNLFLVGPGGFRAAHEEWTHHETVSGSATLGPRNLTSIKVKNFLTLVGDFHNFNREWSQPSVYSLWSCKSSIGLCALRIDKYAWILEQLANFLQTLRNLDLKWKKLDDSQACAMGDVLKLNTTILGLDLGRNEIRQRGGIGLAIGLQGNCTLKTLKISDNSIDDQGAEKFAEALTVNTSLTSLDLSGNRITEAGGLSLLRALQHNNTIAMLSIGGNRMEYEYSNEKGKQLPMTVHATLQQEFDGYNVREDPRVEL